MMLCVRCGDDFVESGRGFREGKKEEPARASSVDGNVAASSRRGDESLAALSAKMDALAKFVNKSVDTMNDYCGKMEERIEALEARLNG